MRFLIEDCPDKNSVAIQNGAGAENATGKCESGTELQVETEL